MFNFNPPSWSAQARELSNAYFNSYIKDIQNNKFVRTMDTTIEELIATNEITKEVPTKFYYLYKITNSYRAPIVRRRAAKRYSRLVKEYTRKHSS